MTGRQQSCGVRGVGEMTGDADDPVAPDPVAPDQERQDAVPGLVRP
jgi:hypothetical protein